jgi:hypothetical protein
MPGFLVNTMPYSLDSWTGANMAPGVWIVPQSSIRASSIVPKHFAQLLRYCSISACIAYGNEGCITFIKTSELGMKGGSGVPASHGRTAATSDLGKAGNNKLKTRACCYDTSTFNKPRSASVYSIDKRYWIREWLLAVLHRNIGREMYRIVVFIPS